MTRESLSLSRSVAVLVSHISKLKGSDGVQIERRGWSFVLRLSWCCEMGLDRGVVSVLFHRSSLTDISKVPWGKIQWTEEDCSTPAATRPALNVGNVSIYIEIYIYIYIFKYIYSMMNEPCLEMWECGRKLWHQDKAVPRDHQRGPLCSSNE